MTDQSADLENEYQEPKEALQYIEPFPFTSENMPFKETTARVAGQQSSASTTHRQGEMDPTNPWAPFPSRAAWKLAEWLMSSGLSNGDRDNFFKLEEVRNNF